MRPWWLGPGGDEAGEQKQRSGEEGGTTQAAGPEDATTADTPPAGPGAEAAGAADAPQPAPAADEGTGGEAARTAAESEPPAGPAAPAASEEESRPAPGGARRAGGEGRRPRSRGQGARAANDRNQREKESTTASDFSMAQLMELRQEVLGMGQERTSTVNDERKIAMFCDLENIALGVRDSKEVKKFDIDLVLERLLEKGKIIVKKAYADWERYSEYKRAFHEAAIELIDIPQKRYSGKNSADIKMVVDAMDLCYAKEHLDTFVVLSGDSDFSPLVSKLKENNKYVIGMGVKDATSNLLVDNCDEFVYYEDVWRDQKRSPDLAGLGNKPAEAFGLMIDAIQALVRENKDVLWGSMIKQTMQRKKPSFNEGYYGYSTFSELLEDAERRNIIKLKKDQRSGTYIVTGFASRR